MKPKIPKASRRYKGKALLVIVVLIVFAVASIVLYDLFDWRIWEKIKPSKPQTPQALQSILKNPSANETLLESKQKNKKLYKREIAGMECIVDPVTGVRRKVITKRRNVTYYDTYKPDRNPLGTVGFFEIHFVFDSFPPNALENEVKYYQIGPVPKKSSILGWVSADNVSQWDMRLGASYISAASPDQTTPNRTPTLLVFATREDLQEYIRTGNSDKWIARTKLGSGFRPMPWPVRKIEFYDYNNKRSETMEIIFLAELTEGSEITEETIPTENPAPAVLTEEMKMIRASINNLDVIFVIDTTLSMRPYIEGVKQTIRKLVSEITGLTSNVAFRLIEYRDYVQNLYFDEETQRVYNQHPSDGSFLDAKNFLEIIAPVNRATVDSEDKPEAVYDGMNAALARSRWRGELSHRVIILIGDDSPHPAGHRKNPNSYTSQNIVDNANNQGIKIFSLLAPCHADQDEQNRHKQEFTYMAEATGGECYELNQADQIIPSIEEILGTQREVVVGRERALVIKTDMPRKRIKLEDLDVRKKTLVMELNQLMVKRDVKDRDIGIGLPTFCSGWVTTESMGTQLIEKKVYVAKPELKFLQTELMTITNMLEMGEDDFKTVFRLARVPGDMRAEGKVNPTGNNIDINPLSIILQEKPGFICAYYDSLGVPQNGLLRLTKDELIHIPQSKKDEIRAKLERMYIPWIINDLNNESIFPFFGKAIKFGWVFNIHIP